MLFLFSNETADCRHLWTKHISRMTFPHPVWMSWWMIPSKGASCMTASQPPPAPHLYAKTPHSGTELRPALLPWWWECGRSDWKTQQIRCQWWSLGSVLDYKTPHTKSPTVASPQERVSCIKCWQKNRWLSWSWVRKHNIYGTRRNPDLQNLLLTVIQQQRISA